MSSITLEKEEVLALQSAVVSRAYVSFDDYLEQSSDTHICEWVDGEIITMYSKISNFATVFTKIGR